MESKKINQLATNVNPQTSDLTTIGDPITGQLKKITWLQVANLIGAQASVTLQQVTDNGNTTTDPITTAGLTLTNLGTGVPQLTNGNFAGTYGYGLANGVATLDSGGKIPASQLPSSVMEYKGTWNASTNTPTLADGTGDNGDVYLVNVAGSQNLGSGTISFAVGDWVVYNGTIWQKSLNSNAVASVFGRTGTIVAQEGDYNIDQLGDVAITSAATNDYLRYNGSSWVNTQFPTFVSSDKLVLQVRNNSGATINKGTVVYINGATAGYPTIAKAQANQDSTSAQTLGLVQDNISNNSNGIVVLVGQITGIDTSAYPAGTQLYLSGTTAGAYTSTKVLAPTHLVYVGIVTTQNAVNGVIEVKIQNGYELDEIHDVAISSVANNQGLFYESSTSLWKNKSIATVLGYTPEQPLTFSSPLVRTTNTISIPAATGSVNGYLTSTDWTTFNNKLTSPMTTLGDIIFGGTSGNANRLAGNITTTKQYLSQTGTGTESASPTWATIAGSDITGAALTKSDDTNVTLTLGGTPATALLRAASLTLGWTGTLAVSRGGTGASSFGSNEIIYGNSASALQSSSQFTFSPTGVFFINNTISAGGIAMNLVSTVNAAANNDIIYGVRISPTFNNGAFTGVTQRALGVFGDVYINGTITNGAWGGATITINKGGTGLSTLGTAGQLLRVNTGATALEYWTPTYISAAITSLNGLTAATQTFATGTSGTDFNISSTTSTHTFNIPSASAANRGLVTTGTQTFAGDKTFTGSINGTNSVFSSSISAYSGEVIIQSAGTNNSWVGNNFYYDNDFKYTRAGFAQALYFDANDFEIRVANTGAANALITWNVGLRIISSSGNVIVPTGTFSVSSTASATAFIPTGSTIPTNGMYLPSANTVAFAANSTRVIQISDSGRVSIGATTPTTDTLTVHGAITTTNGGSITAGGMISAGSTIFGGLNCIITSDLSAASITPTGTTAPVTGMYSASSGEISFSTSTTKRFSISSTGAATFSSSVQTGFSVLIGTSTNPYGLGSLVVNHDATYGRTYFQRGVNLIEIIPSNGTVANQISSSFTSSGSAYMPLSLSARQTPSDLYLATNGNVGIGTTSPDRPLDIYSAATVGIARIRANNVNGAAITMQNDENSQSVSIYAGGSSGFGISGWAGNAIIESITGVVYSAYNGNHIFQSGVSGRTERMRITSGGAVQATNNLTANSPAGGNTGEGIIAGRSFKLDASGSGQRAAMYVVSNTLSDTYGSGLQIQFANLADTLGFGFNLTTGGTYETYVKDSGASWQRRMSITNSGVFLINTSSTPSNTKFYAALGDTEGFRFGNWQSYTYSTNNAWIAENTWFDGNFKRINSGYAYALYSDAGSGFQIRVAGTSSANTTISWLNGITALSNGDVRNYNNSTTWQQSSDIRIKQNIKPITNALNKLLGLNPTHFELKTKLGFTKTGFIAQEFEQIFPGHVNELEPTKEFAKYFQDGEKMKSIDPDLIPYIVKAIQELNAKIDAK